MPFFLRLIDKKYGLLLCLKLLLKASPLPSLPLEGKVPSGSEADEVVCEAEISFCNAAARLHLISQLR